MCWWGFGCGNLAGSGTMHESPLLGLRSPTRSLRDLEPPYGFTARTISTHRAVATTTRAQAAWGGTVENGLGGCQAPPV